MEALAVAAAATMMLLTYALGRRLTGDVRAAGYAAALDIATWHHASRAHTPALVGQTFFLAVVAYLAAKHRETRRPAVTAKLVLLSFVATLSYSATLIHFVLFVAWLVLLELVAARRPVPSGETARFWLAATAGTLGSVAVFYRNFLGSGPSLAQLSPEAYRPPATFLFLRNQVRDTAQILKHGSFVWALVALPAYVRLRAWVPDPFARRVIWAWTAAYVSLLTLKDPLFLPALLLQIKEDLFVASLFSILGGLTLSRLAAAGSRGKLATSVVLAGMLLLRINDYAYNADTIHPPQAPASSP